MQLSNFYKQKCRGCGDHNMLFEGKQSKDCHNCGNTIIWGEPQTSSVGMEGSYVGKMVELYNENRNIWQLSKLVNYNFLKDEKKHYLIPFNSTQ